MFDNGSIQNRIPLAWTWEIVNLSAWTSGVAPGSIVSAHFTDDADERSSNHCSGIILSGGGDGYKRIRFDNDSIQKIPCGWTKRCSCVVMRGNLIKSHIKDDNKKSSYPCNGIVKSVDISTGNINITFENDIGQSNVPGYYVIESYSIEVGDRVDTYYRGGNNKKVECINGGGIGTIVEEKKNSFSIWFDIDEVVQIIPKHWIKEVIRIQSKANTGKRKRTDDSETSDTNDDDNCEGSADYEKFHNDTITKNVWR